MVAYGFKRKFEVPIRVGLKQAKVLVGNIHPKTQTIRAEGKRRHARPGETLQLYCSMRTKSCFKIGDARCINVRPITIKFGKDFDIVTIAGEEPFGGKAEDIHRLDQFAYADGFASWEELLKFWDAEHGQIVTKCGTFSGFLIQWEPIE